MIGSPTEFNKITFDSDMMQKINTYDLSIPINETHQGKDGESEIDLRDCLEDGDQVGNLNSGQNGYGLESNMDQMKIKSQSSMSTTS